MKTAALISATAISLLLTAAPALASEGATSAKSGQRAVVLVSGTAATTPFTTPTSTCRTGYAAGNTWSFLRDYLTKRGYKVYTAPASVGGAQVKETKSTNDGPFGRCPKQLPAKMTINAIGSVDRSGSNLARFVAYLRSEYGVRQVDLVGHSLGGFIGRAGIREARIDKVPVKFTSYSTLGSPWDGTYIANPPNPADPLSACDGFVVCEAFAGSLLAVPGIEMLISLLKPSNTAVWNEGQAGVLSGIPVAMLAGTYFTKPGGSAAVWPNDGIAQLESAFAQGISDKLLPHRSCYQWSLTHSLFVSKGVGLPDDTSLTWSPVVGARLAKVIDGAGSALKKPNRLGCPKA